MSNSSEAKQRGYPKRLRSVAIWGALLLGLIAFARWAAPEDWLAICGAVLCVVVPVWKGITYLIRLDRQRGLTPGLLVTYPPAAVTRTDAVVSPHLPTPQTPIQEVRPSAASLKPSRQGVSPAETENVGEKFGEKFGDDVCVIMAWLSAAVGFFLGAQVYGIHIENHTIYLMDIPGIPLMEPDSDMRLRLLVLSMFQGAAVSFVVYVCLVFVFFSLVFIFSLARRKT